jgi:hypothetical protein
MVIFDELALGQKIAGRQPSERTAASLTFGPKPAGLVLAIRAYGAGLGATTE